MFYLKNFHKYLLCFIPLFLVTGSFLSGLAIVISAIIFLFFSFIEKKFYFFKNKFFICFMIWCLYLIIRSLFSISPILSLESSLFYFRFGIFSLSVWYAIEEYPNFIKVFFYSTLVVYLVLIFDGFFQYFTKYNLLGYPYNGMRISSFFGDEFIMGSYLTRLLPLLFSLFFFLNFYKKSFILFFFSIIFFVDILVFLSGGRTSFFFILLSSFAFIFLLKKYKLTRLVTLAISMFVIFFISINDNSVKERMITNTMNQLNLLQDEIQEDNNFSFHSSKLNAFTPHHESLYYASIHLFESNYLFGIGPKIFRERCKELKNLDEFRKKFYNQNVNLETLTFCSTHPHNTYLQLLTETGIIGTLPVFCIFFLIIFIIIKHFYSNIFFTKNILSDYEISLLICLLITLWPLVPTGNFFNNWLNVIYYLPIGFILQYSYKNNLQKK